VSMRVTSGAMGRKPILRCRGGKKEEGGKIHPEKRIEENASGQEGMARDEIFL